MSGSVNGWLRKCVMQPKTMAILASSTVAAIAAAIYLPDSSLLSASQIVRTEPSAPGCISVSDQPVGMEIIPQRSGVSKTSGSMRIQKVSATEIRHLEAAEGSAEPPTRQRAVLQRPIFSEPQPEILIKSQPEILIDEVRQSEELSARRSAMTGHSSADQQPAGHNDKALSESGSFTYDWTSTSAMRAAMEKAATHRATTPSDDQSAISSSMHAVSQDVDQATDPGNSAATAPITDLPEDSQPIQRPSTMVPAIPYEPLIVPEPAGTDTELNQIPPQNQSDLPRPMSSMPVPMAPQQIVEPPRTQFHYAPQVISQPQPLPSSGHAFVRPGTSGFRATVECDAHAWIDPYRNRTGFQPEGAEPTPAPVPSVMMPPGYSAWWDGLVQQSAGIAPQAIPVDVSSLVQQALVHSPQVQVLQASPEVQRQVVRQEEAAFDWKAFLDTKYDDLNDPVGNTLTTGNNSTRFNDNRLNGIGGLKRRTESGGEFRISQQAGHQYNNSRFLLPNPQSTSRLELSFRQPLLSRAGTVYNQNQIILARINASATGDESLNELQAHLYSVAEVYWKLYRARAEFFQRQKLLASAQKVLVTLEGRNEVDTIPRQILRARAAVARAESRMQRAVTDIRNAESQLRLLVNDPAMLNSGPIEMTPTEMPATIPSPTGLRESLQEALVNRPDISQAIRQMRASGVRLGVSKSEMLPKLDFIVSSYVAGLDDRTQIADSFGNQFSQGRPGYTVGMEFEVPLGNRAARAKLEQRQWELRRAINGFRATVETSLTEVEISSREVDTAWRELLGKYQAMVAAQNEVSYLQDRFDVLPAVEESSMLLLEDLLDGYERLADEESAFAQAQANYALSIILLRRTTGTLMRSRYDTPQLEPDETEYMTSRADQAANGVEAAASGIRQTASSTEADHQSSGHSAPASWSQPLENGEDDNIPPMSAPTPRRRIENTDPQSQPSAGGHSFGRDSYRYR